jgi:hypothetical protein
MVLVSVGAEELTLVGVEAFTEDNEVECIQS